jgi:hypothetical protein
LSHRTCSRGSATKPISNARGLRERFTKGREDRADYRLRLATEMIFKKLVPSDVTGIHAGNGVVHQKPRIELRHACRRCYGSESLSKIIPPF